MHHTHTHKHTQVDTKLKCLNCLTIIMNAMSGRIQPVVQGILEAVPALWEEAKEEHLMMGSVLVTITRLVQAMGASVTAIEAFVVNVIANAADVEAEHELYTLEDGLDLWLSFARNMPHASPALLSLFPLLVKVPPPEYSLDAALVESSLSHNEAFIQP